jgi:hypothetical protein
VQAAALLALWLSGPGTSVTPADSAASSIVGYWLSFGAIAVIAFALFFLYVWPGKLTARARDEARQDLLEENKRLLARAEHAEQQRDDMSKLMQDRIGPILASFTASATALIPLLQDLVRSREAKARGRSGG